LSEPRKPVTFGVFLIITWAAVGHVHFDQHVARQKLPLGLHLATALDLDDVLFRDDHLFDVLRQPLTLRAFDDRVGDLLLEVRVGVDDVPALGHARIGLVHFH
jgi:hypothetical protein